MDGDEDCRCTLVAQRVRTFEVVVQVSIGPSAGAEPFLVS